MHEVSTSDSNLPTIVAPRGAGMAELALAIGGLAIGTGSLADDVEGAFGVIRLGRPGDLDVATLLPFVQHAREAVTHL